MHYLDYNEGISHRTGDLPLAHYYVDAAHPRYHMRMHWHREIELLYMRAGVLHLYVEETPLELSAGDMILLGEGVLHGGEADDGVYECVVLDPYALLMHADPCKLEMKPLIHSVLPLTAQEIASISGFSDALERLYAYALGENALKLIGALSEVFGFLSSQLSKALARDSSRSGVRAEQLKPALEYIEKNYASRITLETLARLTGLSPKYFCRCFRAVVHRSPIDYLNYYRIECACGLLSTTDLTIADIAQRCGFNDSSFFIKQFRKYKQTTPHRYAGGAR